MANPLIPPASMSKTGLRSDEVKASVIGATKISPFLIPVPSQSKLMLRSVPSDSITLSLLKTILLIVTLLLTY